MVSLAILKWKANSLENEMQSFEVIMSVAIWYDILFAVNTSIKTLQSMDMCVALSQQHNMDINLHYTMSEI